MKQRPQLQSPDQQATVLAAGAEASEGAALGSDERFLEREAPLAARVLKVVNVALAIVFAIPITAILFDLLFVVLFALIVSSEARAWVDTLWFSIVIIAGLILLMMALGGLMQRLWPWPFRLIDGPPAFGRLGGGAKHVLQTTIKAATDLRVEFDPSDARLAEELAQTDLGATEAVLKEKYLELAPAEFPDDDEDALEQRWQRIWENEILGYRAGNSTLRESVGAPSYGGLIIGTHLLSVRNIVVPAYKILQLVLIVLVYRALTGDGSWLTVFQVGLVFTFALSMVIYLNHSKLFGELEILPPPPNLPEPYREEWDQFQGKKLIPLSITIAPGYFGTIGRYFARNIGVWAFYNAVVMLFVIACTVALTLVVSPEYRDDYLPWYGTLALALALIPAGMLAAHFFATLILQHARQLSAVVVGGLVTALAPLGVQYLVEGEVSGNTAIIITTVVTGVLGAVAAGFGTVVKERMSAAPPAAAGQPS
jgi:hypothetical protein